MKRFELNQKVQHFNKGRKPQESISRENAKREIQIAFQTRLKGLERGGCFTDFLIFCIFLSVCAPVVIPIVVLAVALCWKYILGWFIIIALLTGWVRVTCYVNRVQSARRTK
jgi:hypothetical protein